MIFLYLSSIGDTITKEFLGINIQFYLIIGAVLIIGLLILIILLIYKTDSIIRILAKISPKIADYVGRFIINFKEGIKRLRENKKTLIYVILLGFPVWIIDAFIVVIFFYISGFQLNIVILILAKLLSFFSKIFPLTPGGWIISENIGAFFIFFFYSSLDYQYEILPLFFIDHLFRSAYVLFFGGYSIFRYNIKLKELEQIRS